MLGIIVRIAIGLTLLLLGLAVFVAFGWLLALVVGLLVGFNLFGLRTRLVGRVPALGRFRPLHLALGLAIGGVVLWGVAFAAFGGPSASRAQPTPTVAAALPLATATPARMPPPPTATSTRATASTATQAPPTAEPTGAPAPAENPTQRPAPGVGAAPPAAAGAPKPAPGLKAGAGVRPLGRECPASHPIKGNQGSRSTDDWIYHPPGSRSYNATDPEECFATEAEARAAGYRAPRN